MDGARVVHAIMDSVAVPLRIELPMHDTNLHSVAIRLIFLAPHIFFSSLPGETVTGQGMQEDWMLEFFSTSSSYLSRPSCGSTVRCSPSPLEPRKITTFAAAKMSHSAEQIIAILRVWLLADVIV